MKTEWEFQFETLDFYFEKEHRYKGHFRQPIHLGDCEIEMLSFEARIVPDKNKPPPGIVQTGLLFISLPFGDNVARLAAYFVANNLTQRISFQSGQFRIHYGAVSCKLIPETPDEEKIVGDTPYSIELHLEELVDTPSFDSKEFACTSIKQIDLRLLSQFNEANSDSSPIRKFLGFFRIIESLYVRSNMSGPIKQIFIDNKNFRTKFENLYPKEKFDDFVQKIVGIRNKCAHLKLDKSFGYTPIDEKVSEEVNPYVIQQIKILAKECMHDA